MNFNKQSISKVQQQQEKQQTSPPTFTSDELQTKATIAETIEIKFFACETRLRELMSTLVEPAISKARISYDTSLFIQQEFQKLSSRVEKLELVTKKTAGFQKRIDEHTKQLGTLEQNINLNEMKFKDLIQTANFKIEQALNFISHQRDDHNKVHQKLDAFNINISKCYEDIFEFKDNMADLLMSFKIEMLVNQEKIMKDLLQLQEHKKTSVFDVEKTKELLDSFDLKLAQYKHEFNNKMETFNPLDYNLMEKDYFQQEQDKTYQHIRQRCQDLAAKIRNLEKYVDVVQSMNDPLSEKDYISTRDKNVKNGSLYQSIMHSNVQSKANLLDIQLPQNISIALDTPQDIQFNSMKNDTEQSTLIAQKRKSLNSEQNNNLLSVIK